MDIATLGLRIDSAGVKEGADKLDSLTASAQRADAAVEGLSEQAKSANKSLSDTGAAATDASKGISAMEAATARLSASEEDAKNRIKAMVQASLEQQRAALAAASATREAAQASRSAGGGGASSQALTASFAASQQELSALNDAMSHHAQSLTDIGELRAWVTETYNNGIISQEDTETHFKSLDKQERALQATIAAHAKEVQNLVREYDPASAALKKITADEQKLQQALKEGAITQEQYNRAQAGLNVNRAKWQAESLAVKELDTGLKGISLTSSFALREYTSMVNGLSNGNLGQVAREAATLGVRSGALALIMNPLGISVAAAAASIGVYAIAAAKAEQESFNFNKAVILSGGAAGVTASQLALMAQHMDDITGTQSAASAALATFAASGKVSADNLQNFAVLAEKLERTVGTPVAETAKQFEELGKSPVEASKKLQEQYGYLTVATYNQIKALQQQGATDAAASLAQQAFAKAMSERVTELDQKLGTLQKTGNAIKSVFAEVWDSMLGVGRHDTLDQQLAKLQAARGNRALGAGFSSRSTDLAETQRENDAREASLQKLVDAQHKLAKEKAESIKETDRQLALEGTIKQVIETQITAANQLKIAQSNAAIGAVDRNASAISAQISNQEQLLSAQRSAHLVTEQQYYAQRAVLIEKDRKTRVDALTEENGILSQQAELLKSANNADIDRANQQGDTLGALKAAQALAPQLLAIQEKIAGNKTKIGEVNAAAATNIQKEGIEQTAANKAIARSYDEARISAQSYLDVVSQQRRRDLNGLGQGDRQRQFNQGINAIDDRAVEQRKALDQSLLRKDITQDQYDDLLKIANDYRDKDLADYEQYWSDLTKKQGDWSVGAQEAMRNYQDTAANVAKQSQDAFMNAFQGMEDQLVSFVMTGKGDFKKFADSVISDLIRIQLKAALANSMNAGGWLSQLFGLFSTATAGSTGGLGAGSDAVVGSGSVQFAASGTNYVQEDNSPFILHKGEAVIPAKYNPAAGGMGMGGPVVNINSTNNFQAGANVAQLDSYMDQRDEHLKAQLVTEMRKGRWGPQFTRT